MLQKHGSDPNISPTPQSCTASPQPSRRSWRNKKPWTLQTHHYMTSSPTVLLHLGLDRTSAKGEKRIFAFSLVMGGEPTPCSSTIASQRCRLLRRFTDVSGHDHYYCGVIVSITDVWRKERRGEHEADGRHNDRRAEKVESRGGVGQGAVGAGDGAHTSRATT